MKHSKASKALLAFHGDSVIKRKYLKRARKYSQLLRTTSNDTAQVMEVLFKSSYLYWEALGEGDKAGQGWRRSAGLKLLADRTDAPEAWALAVSNDIWTSSMDFNRGTDCNWISKACQDWAEAMIAGESAKDKSTTAVSQPLSVPDQDY